MATNVNKGGILIFNIVCYFCEVDMHSNFIACKERKSDEFINDNLGCPNLVVGLI